MRTTKYKKKLLHKIEYPLYIRQGEFGKTFRASFDNNSSSNHQITGGYKTAPIYKEILIASIINEGEKDNATL